MEPEPDEPAFARTSADVVVPEGREYPVNLLFVAEQDSSIWTGLTGVVLGDDASVGPGQFELLQGEGEGGLRLGNISFDISVPAAGLAFDSVGLVYSDREEPITVDVGQWSFRSVPSSEFVTSRAGAEVASVTGCTGADLPLPDGVVAVDALETGSDAVRVTNFSLAAGSRAVRASFSCSDDADFFVASPHITYRDEQGATWRLRFSPISFGFQDIDEADLRAIAGR